MTRNLLRFGWLGALIGAVAIANAAPKKPTPTWTDPEVAAAEDPDFTDQGEYGLDREGVAWGVQVVALGDGSFEAYLLEAGLPGLGWDRTKKRIRLSGTRGENGRIALASADESYQADLWGGVITVSESGKRGPRVLVQLPRVERESPTLGKEPSEDALVLFDGSDVDAWEKGTLEDGLLKNTDCYTKRAFGSYRLHLEFRTPYKPFARGQARGNSGVYHQWRYETQVLDSFGLEGESNETGGIYKISRPRINVCFPPLRWQTYDVDLTTATFTPDGEVEKHARMTVRLNGVLVQDDVELPRTNGGARLTLTPEPGPIYLQSHGNPVYYRNIWIVSRDGSSAQSSSSTR